MLTCPFCQEDDFDAPGLKHHLLIGYCDQFNEVPTLEQAAAIHRENVRLENARLDIEECEHGKRQC